MPGWPRYRVGPGIGDLAVDPFGALAQCRSDLKAMRRLPTGAVARREAKFLRDINTFVEVITLC